MCRFYVVKMRIRALVNCAPQPPLNLLVFSGLNVFCVMFSQFYISSCRMTTLNWGFTLQTIDHVASS